MVLIAIFNQKCEVVAKCDIAKSATATTTYENMRRTSYLMGFTLFPIKYEQTIITALQANAAHAQAI